MLRLLTRLTSALLTVVGLALAAVGAWFLSSVGTAGTATFTATPNASRAVVVPPTVLNRMDIPTTVRAAAGDGGKVWVGVAAPSDAKALLGSSPHFEVNGVSVGDWSVQTAAAGSGEVADIEAQDLWRSRTDPAGTAEVTIEQADAPESVVIVPTQGTVRTVTLEWTKKAWGTTALTVLGVGAALALLGLGLLLGSLLRARKRRRTVDEHVSDARIDEAAGRPTTPSPALVPAVPGGGEAGVSGPDTEPHVEPDTVRLQPVRPAPALASEPDAAEPAAAEPVAAEPDEAGPVTVTDEEPVYEDQLAANDDLGEEEPLDSGEPRDDGPLPEALRSGGEEPTALDQPADAPAAPVEDEPSTHPTAPMLVDGQEGQR